MNNEKYNRTLNNQKFEGVTFALDYIRSMRQITGEIQESDFIACMETLYERAFIHGQRDVLDRHIFSMFHELDEVEDKLK